MYMNVNNAIGNNIVQNSVSFPFISILPAYLKLCQNISTPPNPEASFR